MVSVKSVNKFFCCLLLGLTLANICKLLGANLFDGAGIGLTGAIAMSNFMDWLKDET